MTFLRHLVKEKLLSRRPEVTANDEQQDKRHRQPWLLPERQSASRKVLMCMWQPTKTTADPHYSVFADGPHHEEQDCNMQRIEGDNPIRDDLAHIALHNGWSGAARLYSSGSPVTSTTQRSLITFQRQRQ